MKHLPGLVALLMLLAVASGCRKESVWDKYEQWRVDNNAWYAAQIDLKDADGNKYYTELNPWWNPGSGVLIRYLNDTTLTRGNLSPLQTSTVAVKYKGEFYNGAAFDSSYMYVDSIARFRLNEVVSGWQIALYDMHIGDKAEVVVPYTQGYGVLGTNSILPYTAMKFYIELAGIPYYEQRPD